MLKLLMLAIAVVFASATFINPKLTENLEDTAKLLQCMKVQVSAALGKNHTDIWGFQGPFLISGYPRLVEYKVRLKEGFKYNLRFTTDLHNHWRLFKYTSVNGITRIGATAENMWDEGYLLEKDTLEPIFVDVIPCQKLIESEE